MISSELALLGAVILLTLAFLLSLIDVAFHYLSKVSLRILGEESWKANYLRACLEDPMKLFLPLRIGIQGALIGVTVLLTDFFISSGVPQALLLAFLTMLPIFLIFREALPNIIARRNPERVLLVLLPAFRVYEPMV
ncbi:MAG: CNNM domain-containing protein, partial [Acidobacteriota bacterium]